MELSIDQSEIENLLGHLDAYQAKGLSFLLAQKPDAILYAPVFKEMLRLGLRKKDLDLTINQSIERLQAEINLISVDLPAPDGVNLPLAQDTIDSEKGMESKAKQRLLQILENEEKRDEILFDQLLPKC